MVEAELINDCCPIMAKALALFFARYLLVCSSWLFGEGLAWCCDGLQLKNKSIFNPSHGPGEHMHVSAFMANMMTSANFCSGGRANVSVFVIIPG
jgi:hypothetical protein